MNFEKGQRVTILGACANFLNRGTVLGPAGNKRDVIVRPDGCEVRCFARRTGIMQPNKERLVWPRIVP